MGSDELTEKRRAFDARGRELLRQGLDRDAAADFVAGCAGDMTGQVLDIGTGRGVFAIALARKGLKVTTVDRDDQDNDLAAMLADEAGVSNRVTFMRGDATCLDLPSCSFDCVAMMDVLHHIADPAPVYDEMVRMVRPGGTILIADFDEEGFNLLSRTHRASGGDHSRTDTTVDEALKALEIRGMNLVKQIHGHMHHIVVLS